MMYSPQTNQLQHSNLIYPLQKPRFNLSPLTSIHEHNSNQNSLLTNSSNRTRLKIPIGQIKPIKSDLLFGNVSKTARRISYLEDKSVLDQSESSISPRSPLNNSSLHLPPLKLSNPKLLRQKTEEIRNLYPNSARKNSGLSPYSRQNFAFLPHVQSDPSFLLQKRDSLNGEYSMEQAGQNSRLKEDIFNKKPQFNIHLSEKTFLFDEESTYDTITMDNIKKTGTKERSRNSPTNNFDEYDFSSKINNKLCSLEDKEFQIDTDQQIQYQSKSRLKGIRRSSTKTQLEPQERNTLIALGELYLREKLPNLSKAFLQETNLVVQEENEGDELISNEEDLRDDFLKSRADDVFDKEKSNRKEGKDVEVRKIRFDRSNSHESLALTKKFDWKDKTKTSKKSTLDLLKKKKKTKLNARSKLNGILWTLVYPSLFEKDIQRKMQQKKEEILFDISSHAIEVFIVSAGEKFLKNLICESKSLDLFSDGKPISTKLLDVRANLLFTNLYGLFDKLIFKMTATNIPTHVVKFLITISKDHGILPQDFVFAYELKRLQFDHYGNLKNMSPQKSKMVLGSFILLRVLVYKIIMRPWTIFSDIKEKKVNKRNLLTIGSILYYLVLNFYKRTLPIQHNNQAFLQPNVRLKARREPLKASDEQSELDELEFPKPKTNAADKEKDAITGFFHYDQLKAFFSDRKNLSDQLKAMIEGWHDKIYEVVQAVYIELPKNDIGKLDIVQEDVEN